MTSLAGAGRELRHPDRQPLRLEVASVLPGTLKVYMEGVSRFLRYCGVVRSGQALVLATDEVDERMVEYIQHIYDNDRRFLFPRAVGRVRAKVSTPGAQEPLTAK